MVALLFHRSYLACFPSLPRASTKKVHGVGTAEENLCLKTDADTTVDDKNNHSTSIKSELDETRTSMNNSSPKIISKQDELHEKSSCDIYSKDLNGINLDNMVQNEENCLCKNNSSQLRSEVNSNEDKKTCGALCNQNQDTSMIKPRRKLEVSKSAKYLYVSNV